MRRSFPFLRRHGIQDYDIFEEYRASASLTPRATIYEYMHIMHTGIFLCEKERSTVLSRREVKNKSSIKNMKGRVVAPGKDGFFCDNFM